jgi:phytanoyl-CoA hydroxylase
MLLTASEVARFHEDGYLVVEDVLGADVLGPLIADFNELVADIARALVADGRLDDEYAGLPFERRLAVLTWAAGESLQRRVSFPANHRRAMFDFLTSARLVDLIESLVGPEIYCHPTQHVRPKLPEFVGDRFRDFSFQSPVHQDAAALLPEADDTFVLTSWIPLVDVTEDMGPVEVYPALHRGPIRRHHYVPGIGLTIAQTQLPEAEPVPIPVAKGDVLLIHARTPHRSRTNATPTVRWSIDLRWNDARRPGGRPLPGLVVRSRERAVTAYAEWIRAWADVDHDRVPRVVDRWRSSS